MTEQKHRDEIASCENCKLQLQRVRNIEGLSAQHLFILENPKRSYKVTFPVRMDNGDVRMITGFRIQYNDALGPTKGGIRFHQTVDEEDVTELAFLMSLKTALLSLPYGGAKGGVKINPKELSDGELERVARSYVREMFSFIGPHQDIPAPDVNTNPKIMGWMVDQYERMAGEKSPGAFTGKPLALGGSLGRSSSTAKGAFFILQDKFKDVDKTQISVAIQGFGNAGSHLARMLQEIGFKIVAVSDSKSGIYNAEGLNIHELIEFKKKKSLDKYEHAQKITNEELLELDVNILIPGALGGVIHQENVDKIKAYCIVELANAPITPAADKVLEEKMIEVIPDILANAGGVVVSYFEWIQNITGDYWKAHIVDDRLKERMITAYYEVIEESRVIEKSPRTAAYKLAVDRILEAEEKRGTL